MTKCYLVEADYKALEAQLVGYYAGDPGYLRAAKMGVHAILQSHVQDKVIDLSLPDYQILDMVRRLKKDDPVMYDNCKHVVHGSNYGGSAKRMRMEFPDAFESVAAAKRIQDIYFSTIARKVKQWQQHTLHLAYQQHFLENVFGYRHYFWDALHYVGNTLEWGTDAKKVLAFLPQSTGAGVLSEALLRLHTFPEVFRMARWIIHDSLLAEIPEDKLPWAIGVIKHCMEYPIALLGGLSIEVDVKIGVNWSQMKDYKGEIMEVTQ
ncbi:MAG: DNA polymerase [Thermodesulfovibrionales bacterium]|jgi:hypothetical protein